MIKLLSTHLAEAFEILLVETLLETKGNQSKAARKLGISRVSLRTYLKHFNLLDRNFNTIEELLDMEF